MFGIDDAVTAVSGVVNSVIDRIWPDPTINAQMKEDLAKAQLDGSLKEFLAQTDLVKAQIQVNDDEAKSSSLWVSGWRPYVGWVGGTGFGLHFIVIPMAGYVYALLGHTMPPAPVLDPLLMDVLLGMLGLNMGLRTYEKTKGVAS